MSLISSSTAKHHIICFDPKGEYAPGAIVDAVEAAELQAAHVATLPIDAEAVTHGGPVAGFFMRQWGAGWPLSSNIPKVCCPMMVQVHQDARELHWVAHIVRDPAYAQDEVTWSGLLHLTLQPGIHGGALGIVGATGVSALPTEEEPGGGWLVGGSLNTTCSSEGYASLAFYAAAPGYAVAWAAVSLL